MDTSFIKADIFFVTATVSMIVLTIVLTIVLIYLWSVLADIKVLSKRARDEGEKLLDDVRLVREKSESGGNSLLSLLGILFSLHSKRKKLKRKND